MAYNSAHARTRNVVERCFGVLKSRFRCLDHSGGTLLYTPERACCIVTAVCVLHNFAISRNIQTTLDAGVIDRSTALQPATSESGRCAVPTPHHRSVLLGTKLTRIVYRTGLELPGVDPPPVDVYKLSFLSENWFKISVPLQNFKHFDI